MMKKSFSLQDNCELFGYKEIKPEDWTYYQNGVKVTKPKELKKRIAQERIFRWAGHRSFTTDFSGSVLPKEYFDILDDMGEGSDKYVEVLKEELKGWKIITY